MKFADDPQKFNCDKCPEKVAALRQCASDRDDFTTEDAAFWPMFTRDGGTPFGFCPGKAAWYPESKNLFRLLVVAAETGRPPFGGGLAEQPDWVMEILEWFIPAYKDSQWDARMRKLFGSGSKGVLKGTPDTTVKPTMKKPIKKTPPLRGQQPNGNHPRRTNR